MKECALKLWDQGWETAEIVDTLGISQTSLYQWQTIFDQYNSVLFGTIHLIYIDVGYMKSVTAEGRGR
jgi:hypothetical protein